MKLGELATALGGRLVGDPDTEITGVAGLESAGEGHISFVANPKYAPLAKNTKAAAAAHKDFNTNAPSRFYREER